MKKEIKKKLSPFVKEIRILLNELKRFFLRKKKLRTLYPITVISNRDADTYFGYYDISPFCNHNVLYVIKHRSKNYLDIAINDINGTKQILIAKTQAWNWQQGCRLRWFPSEKRVISYNDWDETMGYKNVILNIDNKQKIEINYPLYDINYTGDKGLSIDFERLGRLRPGYGYTQIGKDLTILDNHGIDIIDIPNNKILSTLTYDRIISNFKRNVCIDNCYLNHLSFSPDGSKFLFFLIEIVNGYHLANLLVYDIKIDKVIILDENEKVSHYVWKDNNSIICTAYKNLQDCYYYLYDVNLQTKKVIAPKSLDTDGHPSMSIDDDIIMTDTYPDSMYFQHLMLVDIKHDIKTVIADIYSNPHVTGEMRTDLHPRFNEKQSCISFDANINGFRSFYIMQRDIHDNK